ncbi:MAG: FAD:protein FMN transferase [Planctomycetes bacterium]|nr:FAD:protein FMN transferase [Planctomycetota bacterium]
MSNGQAVSGAVLALTVLLAVSGCSKPPVELVEARLAMDTEVTVRAIAPNEAIAKAAIDAAWKEMDECIFCLDGYRKPSEAWLKGTPKARKDRAQQPSDVWRINHEAGQWNTTVDPITTTCLSAAKEVWEMTGGAFDPTVGPAMDRWRRAAEENRLPADDQVAKARALVGMDRVEIMIVEIPRPPESADMAPPERGSRPLAPLTMMVHTVGLEAGMQLDLGGIAKGYIAGRMASRMKQAGAAAGLVAAAGDVYAFGERPAALARDGAGRNWVVGVQDPRFPADRTHLYTRVRLRDQGIDTSGHYHRGFTIQGKRYSHIVDPRTGRPVDMRLASITVVAADPALSDALATAIAVMGPEKGLALVNQMTGAECLLLEVRLKEGQGIGPDGAPPPDAELIAYRSKGFSDLEVKPDE